MTDAESCAIAMCGQDETEGVPTAPVCCNGHRMHWSCLTAFLESAKSNNTKRVCPLCRDDYLDRLKNIETAATVPAPSWTLPAETMVTSIAVVSDEPAWEDDEHYNSLFNLTHESRSRSDRGTHRSSFFGMRYF